MLFSARICIVDSADNFLVFFHLVSIFILQIFLLFIFIHAWEICNRIKLKFWSWIIFKFDFYFKISFTVMGLLFMYRNFFKKFTKFRLNISGKRFFPGMTYFVYFLINEYFHFKLSKGSEISLAASCKTAASSVGMFTILKGVSKLALIIFYFYACDRYHIFLSWKINFSLVLILNISFSEQIFSWKKINILPFWHFPFHLFMCQYSGSFSMTIHRA